ncbi:hypothetical protein VHEMI08043 [[Torrubiella] hemipterigena]|uniref:Heterokaryon incompatibility domain-containing protein n=1 Tax=[Torrubiella] hemipterigena TaxID=1531966 RepID=A0A0A1TMR5_9HYPO|nr:hypothetical protein VHEMI08043 [[Torrubiella] hemipterigena]
MRLINATSLELEFFIGTPPPYGILSHRWEDEEVSFQDMESDKAKALKGFAKIENCAYQARKEGLGYIWVDTCCIDKTSSAELSEAINSMFQWYQESAKCFVFMYDVAAADEFEASQWFTRGWTLQELIAPKHVEFLTMDWKPLGDRAALKDSLTKVTRISEEALMGADLATIPACQKMAWAANRRTTKAEDLAYCMMGLFGVNMPLLYGEGEEKAFMRLQEHFLKESDDESIFAWMSDEETAKAKPFWGLLAPSPKFFAGAEKYTQPQFSAYREGNPTELTNRGLRISLVLQPLSLNGTELLYIAALSCCHKPDDPGDLNSSFSITLQKMSGPEPQYARIRPDLILPLGPDYSKEGKPLRALLRGLDRDPLRFEQIFVRPVPKATQEVAGFCINGIQSFEHEYKDVDYDETFHARQAYERRYNENMGYHRPIGSAYTDVIRTGTAQYTFEDWDEGMKVKHSLIHLRDARENDMVVSSKDGRKYTIWSWKLKTRLLNHKGGVHNPFGSRQDPVLIVGLENYPDNPLGPRVEHQKPWYTFADNTSQAYQQRLVNGDEPLELIYNGGPLDLVKVEFVPATYRYQTFWDVRFVEVEKEPEYLDLPRR